MAQPTDRKGDLQLLFASAVTGVAGAGFILTVERHLGLVQFAPIAQLWSIWSISAASLMFAYQQWAIRMRVSHSSGYLASLRGQPLTLLVFSVLGAGLGFGIARSTLFQTSSLFWPIAAALIVLGTILGGITRGVLARANRSTALAISIAAENLIRFALAITIILLGAPSWWFGVALLAGFSVIALLLLPDQGPQFPVHSATGGTSTLGSAAVAGFLSHAALAGPPILAATNGGSPETVSTMFVVLSAVRLPHLLLQAGAPRSGVIFQHWVDTGMTHNLRRARIWVAMTGMMLAALAGLIGAGLGDRFIGTVFAIRGEVDPLTYSFISAAAVLSVTATLATVQLVAEQRNRLVVNGWAFPLAGALGLALALEVTELDEIALGLLLLHLIVLSCLTLLPLRRQLHSANQPG